ncbi:hypothetical protein LCGC14_1100200 [marine sediment metagenome]|uniref:Uncharacterized protein n=1 Tax=marine sediment metagenome TaxID=412755 RepID=A0A0F9ME89_9ZZZZ
MGEGFMISGVKRKKTAIEGAFRFFQTVDLIISHFKREADKNKIFELISQESTFNDLLIATAAIHIYHSLGIRVHELLDLDKFSYDSTKNLEISEKKIIVEEVNSLLKDSLLLEVNLLNKIIDLENKFILFLIEERNVSLQEIQKNQMIKDIEIKIEQELQEIILNYPPFYFYDLLGDIIGLTNEVKKEILEESAAFKDISVELEKKLELEEKEDKLIELATLSRLINKLRLDFEFKSYKELQVEAMPVRMIKRKVIDYNFAYFPISVPGLNAFIIANNLKKDLIKKIEDGLKEKTNYDKFEKKILDYLKLEIIAKLKGNPNDFVYFLQSLNECNFDEIVYTLNKCGVYNILHLINVDEELSEKVKRNMIRYNIKKLDIVSLNDKSQNLIYLAKKAITQSNFQFNRNSLDNLEDFNEIDLINLINQDKIEYQDLFTFLEEKTGKSINVLREYIRKKEAIDNVFLNELSLKNYSHILFILEFEEIINKLAKDIFFYILSKILRQLSRIIELYLKVSNDRSLFLLTFKKIYGTTYSEEWIRIKLEELIIERITKRQEELVIVLNALDKPFLVNGFILARLKEISLKKAIIELKNKASPIYEGIAPLKLKPDLISPISYCISYDIVKRFEKFEESRISEVERIIVTKEKEKEEKAQKLREQQELSTLNWIERRITSSLMRINSPGINPNQLYWKDKDTKIVTDNIKLHSELKGDPIELIIQFFNFAIKKIKDLSSEIKLPDYEKIKIDVNNIVEKILIKRLGKSQTLEEKRDLLDGERYEIGNQIAIRIGRLLDKALYSKFKNKQRSSKSF